jgi:hypothetical protein
MKRIRVYLAAAAVAGGLAASGAATTASASAATLPTLPSLASWNFPAAINGFAPPLGDGGVGSRDGVCGSSSGAEGQGGTAGTNAYTCVGAGLVFVGPAIGQIASVIGPTIIGPGYVGAINVSAGDGSINGAG